MPPPDPDPEAYADRQCECGELDRGGASPPGVVNCGGGLPPRWSGKRMFINAARAWQG